MKKSFILFITAVFLFTSTAPVLAAKTQNNYPKIIDIKCENYKTGSVVFFELDKPAGFMLTATKGETPSLIVSPTGKVYSELVSAFDFEEEKGLVKTVKIVKDPRKPLEISGQFYNAIDFIEIKLKKGAQYELAQLKNTLVVKIGKPGVVKTAQLKQSLAQAILKDINVDNKERDSKIEIASTMPIRFVSYAAKDPKQIIFDPVGKLFTNIKPYYYFDQGLVESIKLVKDQTPAPDTLDPSYYSVDFVLVQFRMDTGCEVRHSGNDLVINAKGYGAKLAPKQRPVQKQEPVKKEEPVVKEDKPQVMVVKKDPPAGETTQNPKKELVVKKEEVITLTDINKIDKDDNSAITLLTDAFTPYIYYQLSDPLQLVVDPLGTIYTNSPKDNYYEQGIVESVKIIAKGDALPKGLDSSYYGVDYVLIKLRKHTKYAILQSGGELNIAIGDIKKTLLAEETLPPKIEAKKFAKAKGSELIDEYSGEALTFNECFDTALANHLPARVAIEEIKLQKMKVDEARRALFPNITLRATQTKGDVYQVGFTEKRYGVQIDQPIYYSGRLWNTFKQAKLNYQVAQAKFGKVKSELAAKVAEAYYNLTAAQDNLEIQKELLGQAKEIFEKSRKAREKELVTEVESLTVESSFNQVSYNLESAKKDFDLSRLSLQNAMGLDKDTPIRAKSGLQFKYWDIQLSDALSQAYASRPELLMNDLMVKVSMYEEKIARGKTGFKIDLSGFYGKSGSAYVGETLQMQTDYSIGVQASRGFWGNTLSYSYNKDKTAPKLGETTRTRSETHNAELAILNNMQGNSEIQAARVAYLKAKADLVEMQRNVEYEIKDAYYNCEKSAIQVKNIATKIQIREKELKLTQLQTGLKEAPLSALMESWIKLTDEKTLYNTTLSGYYIAIAKLNKAVGIIDYQELPQ